MLRFVVRRLLQLIPILFGLSILLFAWLRLLPGGPASALLGERQTPERVAAINQAYGLDQPIYVQYWRYLQRVIRFDFGDSIQDGRPVLRVLLDQFPGTVELAFAALLFAVVIGIPLGYFAARRQGTALDGASVIGSLIGITIPVFFLAFLLKYVFAVRLGWLPPSGRQDVRIEATRITNFFVLDGLLTREFDASWDAIWHLILPAIALGTIPLAIIVRITRAAVLDVVNEDYVRTAEAKGLTTAVIRRRHVLRNAMLPVVTTIGLQLGLLLSGAILTERVFAFPGIGQEIADSIFNKDYPVLQGAILLIAVLYVLINLLVDVLYGLLDPRVRVR
jgi:peptide/nickel transport system permease protein